MHIIRETIEELKEQYFADDRPWVVTYSGGKDSTCVLQLTLTMLQMRGQKIIAMLNLSRHETY